jgi:hypothetical protein
MVHGWVQVEVARLLGDNCILARRNLSARMRPIALLRVYPTRIPISEVSHWGLIAVDQGTWRLKGIGMCTSHRLDRKDKQFSTPKIAPRDAVSCHLLQVHGQ